MPSIIITFYFLLYRPQKNHIIFAAKHCIAWTPKPRKAECGGTPRLINAGLRGRNDAFSSGTADPWTKVFVFPTKPATGWQRGEKYYPTFCLWTFNSSFEEGSCSVNCVTLVLLPTLLNVYLLYVCGGWGMLWQVIHCSPDSHEEWRSREWIANVDGLKEVVCPP